MKKVLVTGASGFLGINLCMELLSRGYFVNAVVSKPESAKFLKDIEGINIAVSNILDAEKLKELSIGMDVVINCAANTALYPKRSENIRKVNITGVDNLINACLENKVGRFIQVGTANSFGSGTLDNLGAERNAYEGAKYELDYIDSKFKAQNNILKAVKDDGLDAVVVNPTFMIGPNDVKPSSGAMVLGIRNRKVPAYTSGGKNFVYVKDVAVGIANAIELGRKGECYILGSHNLKYQEFFEITAELANVKPPKIKLPNALALGFGRLNSGIAKLFNRHTAMSYEAMKLSTEIHYYSSDKAIKEINFPQTDIKIAVEEGLDWFKKHNY